MISKLIIFFSSISILFIFSCKDNTLPKPIGQLRLEYPKPKYITTQLDCPFVFDKSNFTFITPRKENCWFTMSYPKMKAKIHLTYLPVNNNIKNILKESQKLVYEHTIRAAEIKTKSFSYPEKKVFGNFYTLTGESAANFHVYATDSTKHFLEATVYFQTHPNFDSLAPAIEYVGHDVLKMIETLKWKN